MAADLPLIYRLIKGDKVTKEEGDANLAIINAAIKARAAYQLIATQIVGFTGDLGASYPAISRPIEVLSSLATPASCALTSADEVLDSFTIWAGTLGVSSILQIEPLWTFGSSANNKILKIKIGGVTVYSATRTTSVKEAPLIVLANRNSLSSQIQPYDYAYSQAGAAAPSTYAIDFSVNQTVEFIGQRASSGDALTLEYYRCLNYIGG